MPLSNQGFYYIFTTWKVPTYVIGKQQMLLLLVQFTQKSCLSNWSSYNSYNWWENRPLSADSLMHIYNILNIKSQVICPLNDAS